MAIVTRLVLWFMIHDLYRMNESNNLFVVYLFFFFFFVGNYNSNDGLLHCEYCQYSMGHIYFAQHKHSTIPTVSSSIIHSQKQSINIWMRCGHIFLWSVHAKPSITIPIHLSSMNIVICCIWINRPKTVNVCLGSWIFFRIFPQINKWKRW